MVDSLDTIAGLSRPLRDALGEQGFSDVASLHGAEYADLLALHGVGKAGLTRLQAALQKRGLSLAGIPTAAASTDSHVVFTEGLTGVNTDDYAGGLTGDSAVEYVESLGTPRRIKHGRLLLEIFGRATGASPRMWGPTMIGYGELHYRYATGREGDTFRVGFSPRAAKISLYGLPHDASLLATLGKHTTGASCVYINKPEDVDLDVLEELIRQGFKQVPKGC